MVRRRGCPVGRDPKANGVNDAVRDLIAKGTYTPFETLTRVNADCDDDFVLSAELYSQAATLVGHLIEK